MRPQTKVYDFDTHEEKVKKSSKERKRFVDYVRRENLKKLESHPSHYQSLYSAKTLSKPIFHLLAGPAMKVQTKKKKTITIEDPYALPPMKIIPFPADRPTFFARFFIPLLILLLLMFIFCLVLLEQQQYLDISLIPFLKAFVGVGLTTRGAVAYISIVSWCYSFMRCFVLGNPITSKRKKTFRYSVMVVMTVLCLHLTASGLLVN